MNDAYQKYLDLSIVHFMAFPEVIKGSGPILETLEVIATDPFFTAIEVGQIEDSAVRKEAATLLRTSHLKVGFGAQPVVLLNKLNPHSPDKAERVRALELLKGAADQAAELGAERMGLLSGPDPADGREQQIEIFADFLSELSSYVESLGLKGLALETFDYDIDKKALIGPNTDAARLAEMVRRRHPNFGLMVDLSHLPLQHENIEVGLGAVADYLVHAHIGNCVLDNEHPAYGDQHPRFGIEGGENDTTEVVAFLKGLFKIGFLGGDSKPFLGFEVKPLAGESPHVVIANAKRVFLEAWAHLEVTA
jgi:sugar phosphate isomerase/epimerase